MMNLKRFTCLWIFLISSVFFHAQSMVPMQQELTNINQTLDGLETRLAAIEAKLPKPTTSTPQSSSTTYYDYLDSGEEDASAIVTFMKKVDPQAQYKKIIEL